VAERGRRYQLQVGNSSSKPAIHRRKTMNLFYIIGVVVVVIFVAGFLGFHI